MFVIIIRLVKKEGRARWWGSNPGRLGQEANVLTTIILKQDQADNDDDTMVSFKCNITHPRDYFFKKLTSPGLEPATCSFPDKRSNHWTMWTYLVDDMQLQLSYIK